MPGRPLTSCPGGAAAALGQDFAEQVVAGTALLAPTPHGAARPRWALSPTVPAIEREAARRPGWGKGPAAGWGVGGGSRHRSRLLSDRTTGLGWCCPRGGGASANPPPPARFIHRQRFPEPDQTFPHNTFLLSHCSQLCSTGACSGHG